MSVIKRIIPSPVEVTREAIIVISGATIAAVIVSQLPGFRDWIKKQWDGTHWIN